MTSKCEAMQPEIQLGRMPRAEEKMGFGICGFSEIWGVMLLVMGLLEEREREREGVRKGNWRGE